MKLSTLMAPSLGLVVLSVIAAETYQTYQVKPGDTLSEILHLKRILPLYGRQGSIALTQKLNPEKVKHEGNQILPGTVIILPLEESREMASFTPSDETTLTEPTEAASSHTLNDGPSSYFSAQLRTLYFRIDSTDLTSKDKSLILSTLSPEISGSWNLRWSEKSLFQFSLGSLMYSAQRQSGIQYKNRNGFRNSLSAAYFHEHGSFTSMFGLSMREELFPYAKSLTELMLEKKAIPTLSAGIRYPFLQKKNAVIGGKLSGDYLFAQKDLNYNISSGHRFHGGVYFNHKNHSLEVFYSQGKQDTSLATKEEKQIGLMYGINFEGK